MLSIIPNFFCSTFLIYLITNRTTKLQFAVAMSQQQSTSSANNTSSVSVDSSASSACSCACTQQSVANPTNSTNPTRLNVVHTTYTRIPTSGNNASTDVKSNRATKLHSTDVTDVPLAFSVEDIKDLQDFGFQFHAAALNLVQDGCAIGVRTVKKDSKQPGHLQLTSPSGGMEPQDGNDPFLRASIEFCQELLLPPTVQPLLATFLRNPTKENLVQTGFYGVDYDGKIFPIDLANADRNLVALASDPVLLPHFNKNGEDFVAAIRAVKEKINSVENKQDKDLLTTLFQNVKDAKTAENLDQALENLNKARSDGLCGSCFDAIDEVNRMKKKNSSKATGFLSCIFFVAMPAIHNDFVMSWLNVNRAFSKMNSVNSSNSGDCRVQLGCSVPSGFCQLICWYEDAANKEHNTGTKLHEKNDRLYIFNVARLMGSLDTYHKEAHSPEDKDGKVIMENNKPLPPKKTTFQRPFSSCILRVTRRNADDCVSDDPFVSFPSYVGNNWYNARYLLKNAPFNIPFLF